MISALPLRTTFAGQKFFSRHSVLIRVYGGWQRDRDARAQRRFQEL